MVLLALASLARLDSVPVGGPQIAGASESLRVLLENREMVSINIICCGRQTVKRKNVLETVA